jgi:hypothetical protein
MPPLGFLGFPPFALECYVVVNLLNRVRRGRAWEGPEARGPGAPRALAAAGVAAALLWNLAVYAGIDRFTVQSYSPELRWMEGIEAETLDRLEQAGVTRPLDVLRRTGTPEAAARLAAATGVAPEALGALRAACRLADTRGLGAAHSNTLRRLGITTVEILARQDPAALHARWEAAAGARAPTPAQVRVWVRAARAEADQAPGRRGAAGSGRTWAAFRMAASIP